jgi:20S proteasome alpha/beta subunit
LSGTTVAGGIVSVYDGEVLLGSSQADAAGLWNFTIDNFIEGAHSFTAAADLSADTNPSATLPANLGTLSSLPFAVDTASVTVAEGASVEINGLGPQSVTFTGTTGTLKIEHAFNYAGQISGLAGADALDLSDLSYGSATTATFLGNTTGGTLTVTNGTQTANISLIGNYLSSSWTLSSDGHGGTVVIDPVPANNWKELKIGAGGWLVGMDIAPDDTMVVRTDTYGAYIWNGTQWQQLVTSTSMPAADVGTGSAEGVYEIRIAPSNTNILYMEYLGNVYRSNDKGATWTKTAFSHVTESPNDLHRMNGQKMAVDPNNANVVYVGTPQDGLFVTRDGGTSWQKISAVPVSAQDGSGQYPGITGITFDPTSGTTGGKTNTIFASSYGHGVYESTNGGVSWTALSGGPSDVEYAAISSTGVYYAVGNNNSSLWKFTNGAWTQLNPDNSQGIHTVSIDPFNPLHIIVGTPGGNLNQSLDGGATWGGINWAAHMCSTDVPWLANTEQYMSSGGMAFDQLVPNKFWASDGIGVWNASVPQNMTWNTPVTWNSQSAGIEQLVANEILVAPGGKPIVASWDRPFFYVSDPNSYPTSYGVGNPNKFSAGWSLDYASSNPNFIVGINDWWGTEQSGYSTDGGQTWHTFPNMPSFAGTTIGGTIAASSPTEIVWAPANRVAPQYTKDGGVTWKPVVLPGVSDWSGFDFAYYLYKRTVTADRVLPDTFYMYYNGVYKTADGGDTWIKVFTGEISQFSGANSRIEAVPGKAGNLFFTGGPQGVPTHPAGEGFYQSTDGGSSWTAVPNVLEVSTFGFGAPATPAGYPSIYIVGYVNSVYGIWQSNDDAHSWTMIGDYPNGSLDTVKTIAGDPNIYGQVYVGFTGSGYAYLPAAPVTPPADQAPVVTALNTTLSHNQNIAASSLFTATDPDGQTITTYALKDVTGNGHFVVNGVAHGTNVEIDLTAPQLAQTTYQSGSGPDQLSIRASDGTLWSAWQTVTVTAPVDQAPVVTTSNKTVTHNQSIAASSLFTATDPEGDTITTYALKDVTGNGHFVVNGVVQASNVEIDLTAAQLAQTTYVAGSATDQFSVRAFDGTLWSGWQTATITAPVNQAPIVKASNKTLTYSPNASSPSTASNSSIAASSLSTPIDPSIAASSLFTATDPDGDPITTYALKDVTGNGYFVVNGVAQATNVEIDLTAAQLAQTIYQSGSGSDQLSVSASDGTLWSTWQNFTVTGPVVTVVEAFGSTSLTAVGAYFYLFNGSGSGPQLKIAGAGVAAGQTGVWAPIGAEQTATGYEVAWKVAGGDQYGVWKTDSNGTYISNVGGVVSGASTALKSLETALHQDLNGDGVVGLVTTIVESSGSTSLTEVGNNFYLYNSSGSGPSLKLAGVDFAAGQAGAWTPIGAEQTATGYEVAWKVAGADQYSVWNTGSNGNYIANAIGVVSGTSSTLQSFETSFHQDLNGDGVIGALSTVLEAFGSTSLVESGNNFYLYSNASGSGLSLKYGGAAVAAGQWGGWAPIGAEQTASGYEVTWKVTGADQYSVWNTDSSGNYTSNAIGVVSGSSATLKSFETSFHQDLNGNGVIGATGAIAQAKAAVLVNAGATVEITTPYAGQVTFNASTGTLKLDNSSNFSGTVVGINAQDTLDLADINFATLQQPVFSGNTSGGTLSVTDGTHTANIALLGSYMASTFVTSSDGHGGTYVVDPSAVSQSNLLAHA